MYRKEVVNKLNELSKEINIPVEDMIIITSGSLVLRGLRDTCGDIDVIIPRELANNLNHLKAEIKLTNDEVVIVEYKDYDIIIYKTNPFTEFECLGGYNVEKLKHLVERKISYARDKDFEHLAELYTKLYPKINKGTFHENYGSAMQLMANNLDVCKLIKRGNVND